MIVPCQSSKLLLSKCEFMKDNNWYKMNDLDTLGFIFLACFLVADVKLNETSLKFYQYDNKGSPSATPKGGYIGTITKVDSSLVDYGRSLKYKSKPISNIIEFVMLACHPIKRVSKFINTRGDKLWVKVKDVEMFQEVYKPEIDTFLEEYDISVDMISHFSSCNYAEPPEFR